MVLCYIIFLPFPATTNTESSLLNDLIEAKKTRWIDNKIYIEVYFLIKLGFVIKAVDKYTAGISVLMPLLQNEPKGRR